MFSESEQIVATRNGVTILKPHWMSQEYWQNYVVPRCGKVYNKAGVPFGSKMSADEARELRDKKAREEQAAGGDECTSCKI